jgi:hypothetical protein
MREVAGSTPGLDSITEYTAWSSSLSVLIFMRLVQTSDKLHYWETKN